MAETDEIVEGENSISDIRKFFEKDARPYKSGEFIDFWRSLTDVEKSEFKKANLG